VNKANQNQKNIRPRQVTLYRNVFYSRVSTAVVLWLCVSFLLQPIERMYASEIAPIETNETTVVNLAVDAGLSKEPSVLEVDSSKSQSEPSAETETEVESEVGADISLAEPEVSTSVIGTTTIESSTLLAATTTNEIKTSTSTSTIGTSTNQLSDIDFEPFVENSTDGSATESELNTSTSTTLLTDAEIQDLITEADELSDSDFLLSTTSTTTITDNLVAVSTVYSDAVMQFNRNDCVTVEDGSFYCQNKKPETEQGTDGMYALQDKDGDLEIFLQKNGELVQLTFNTLDDAAPVFDAKSNTIVWHRLVDERYQIISFDIKKNEEIQLTADKVNNMEPSRSGNFTVWQRWNNNNWDIVLYDGRETKFISESPLHDIAPNVKGDLVMWNRLSTDNTQSIELYDLVTGEYTTITDEEGGALSNPRMVLVYETQFANGDVVTKGYDIKTGEVTPLANDPGELPDELPEPDPMEETRALVQPKNPIKDDAEFLDEVFPGIDTDPANASSTATTTRPTVEQDLPSDLYIASSSPYIAGSTPNVNSATSTIADLTLDLNPPVALNPDIPADLVVLPFAPTLQFVDVETNE
jgi:hypothetical protein